MSFRRLSKDEVASAIAEYQSGVGAPTIGRRLGVSTVAIYWRLHQAGIGRRAPGHNFYRGGTPTVGKVCERCGTAFSVPDHRANKQRRFCSWKCRSHWNGPTHHNAKLDASLEASGYRTVRVSPEEAVLFCRRGRQRMPEHIYIACKTLGRPLGPNEVVHHINCDKSDNRRSNLLICDRAYHVYLHSEMSRRWAKEHFN